MITQIIAWILGPLSAIVFVINIMKFSKGRTDRPMTPGERGRYLFYMLFSFAVAGACFGTIFGG